MEYAENTTNAFEQKTKSPGMNRKIRVLFWPGCWYPDRFNPLNSIFVRRHAKALAPLVDLPCST